MTALPVAYYLKELSGEAPRRGGRGFGSEDASDLDLQIKEAHQRGVAEGRAAAQAEHEAALAAEAATFEQKLASERERWTAEQGVRLGELVTTAMEDIERRVADAVSEVLKPVLRDEIRGKAVETLAHTLNDLLAKGEYAKITVSGPTDLLAAMEGRIGSGQPGFSFVEARGVDLTVNADETILATQIGAWMDAIAGTSP